MNFFEKSKVLTIAILGLLILNFVTLAFLIFHRPHFPFPIEPPRKEARGFLENELNLTDQQKIEFNRLREEHISTVAQIQDSIKPLKDQLFDQIKNDRVDTATVNSITSKIAENQKRIELATFYHFNKIRTLLNDEQKKKFDMVMKDMLKMTGPHPPEGPEMRPPGEMPPHFPPPR